MKTIKLSQYAKDHSICYKTAWNRFKDGKIPNAHKEPTGSILVEVEEINKSIDNKIIIYTRVSSSQNKTNLVSQADRLSDFAISNGYEIIDIIKEVGSGVNDSRPKLIKLLNREDYSAILIEHKDRLTRFGFNYLETLLNINNRKIIVANLVKDRESDIMQDMIAVLYSFSAKLYGQRRAKNISSKIEACINKEIKE